MSQVDKLNTTSLLLILATAGLVYFGLVYHPNQLVLFIALLTTAAVAIISNVVAASLEAKPISRALATMTVLGANVIVFFLVQNILSMS